MLTLTFKYDFEESSTTQDGRKIEAQAVSFTPLLLNLELSSDAVEQARLRSKLSLPKQMQQPSSQVPLQIKWNDVPGPVIYNWLTSQDGIKITILGTAKIVYIDNFSYILDLACLEKYDSGIFSESSIKFKGSAGALLLTIASSGCLNITSSSGRLTQPTYLPQNMLADFSHLIGNEVVTNDGISEINTKKLEVIFSKIKTPLRVLNESTITLSLPLGRILIDNPNAVKDITSGKVGLDALLGTN